MIALTIAALAVGFVAGAAVCCAVLAVILAHRDASKVEPQ